MLKRCSVVPFFLAVIAAARVFLQSRTDLAVEILALRQQVAVLKRRRPKPPLHPLDRLFWTVLRLGLAGRMRSSSSSRKQSSVGIGLDSSFIGVGNLDRVVAGQGLPRKFAS